MPLRRVSFCAIFALLVASWPAISAEIRLIAPALSAQDQERVRANSVLFAIEDAAQAIPQDLISAGQADYERLLSVLYDLGRFGSQISIRADGREVADLSALSAPVRVRQMVIRIIPGPPYRFGVASIAPLAFGSKVPDEFARRAPASIASIRSAVDTGINDWRDTGHAKVRVSDQSITVDHGIRVLNAQVTLDPGPKLRFGTMTVAGNTDVRTRRVVQIAGFPAGRVFSPDLVDAVQTRLRRTGTFSSAVLIEDTNPNSDNTLDFELQVAENLPRRVGFGGEISSQDGVTISGFWLHRNVLGDAGRLRFEGEVADIGGETSAEDLSLSVRYDRPATFNEDTDFYALTSLERLDEPNFKTRSLDLEIGIRRYATARREYTLGIGLETAKTEDAFGDRRYTLMKFPLGTTFDYRDDTLDAKSGYFANLGATPFYGLDGISSGLRLTADLRGYYSLGTDKKVTLAVRGQLGSVSGASLSNAPTDFLFYSGGGGTVRGQDFQSLGVDLPGDETAGGRAFLGLSGEIRAKTTENLSLVGFWDAGYIGREAFPDGSSGRWHSGAGIGARYNTGIGPIRLDLAVPVSGPGDMSGFQIYVGIGQAF
ncbi:MAG: BamA/TamA family outer membrane protein [Pseudomonadota bacterium]